jgi:hypothetical protein
LQPIRWWMSPKGDRFSWRPTVESVFRIPSFRVAKQSIDYFRVLPLLGRRATTSRMDLKHIPIESIVPNAENPRGIDIPTKDPKLGQLKDSISRFGVLVPIVVTPKGKGFLLVDGERRYHAAKATNQKNFQPT